MNCRRAHSEIALWAGDDLDEDGLQALQRHLEACPACRCYLEEMKSLMRLVDECPLREEADEASKRAVADSLWPSLSTRLVSMPAPRSDRFNGWVPAVAVAAVCLAMVLIASPPQMLALQEASVSPSANEEDWPMNQDASPMLSKADKLPIATHPVDLRPKHPMEELFSPGSGLPPEIFDPHTPFHLSLDQFGPKGPILYYMKIK